MEIKLMSLGLETTPEITKCQGMIESAFNEFFDQEVKFEQYNSEKIFVTELSNSVKNDDIIVLATESELFVPFKNFIAKAFKLNKKYNRHIAKKIKFSHPEIKPESDLFEAQSTIPSNSTPIFSDDGLYTGFAVKSNQQIVIVLPLDESRLDLMLNKSVAEYLENTIPDKVTIKEQEKEQEYQQPYNEKMINSTVEMLVKNQQFIAMAQTKTVDFLGPISAEINDLKRVLNLSEYSIEIGQMPPREYAINMARGAMQSAGSPIGACITNVFTASKEDGSTEMFLYVCIADENNANAIKMFSKQDETLPQLVFDAIDEMFKMIYMWSDTGKVIPPLPEKPKSEKEKEQERKDKKYKRQTQIIVSVMLVFSIIASILVAVFANDIYNIRGTLAQSGNIKTDSGVSTPLAESVNATVDNGKTEDGENEHGGLELDSVFIDSIDKTEQTTEKQATGSTPSKEKETTTTTTTKQQITQAQIRGDYPATLSLGGENVDTPVAIARIVEAEMGKTFSEEALKAQTVAVFSYIKCNNWSTSGLSKSSSYSDKVMNAVKSVLGQTVTYNGRTALTPFFAMSAGKTVASTTVWNSNNVIPYLNGGVVSEEKNSSPSGYKTTAMFSSAELKNIIESKLGVTLSQDPSSWIVINAHDSSVSADTGYISSMTVGGKTITGHYFRSAVLSYKIRSQCFNVAYNAENDSFTFTVYGYGHGAGMSQQGANYYAKQGWNYIQILKHYYPGTQVG